MLKLPCVLLYLAAVIALLGTEKAASQELPTSNSGLRTQTGSANQRQTQQNDFATVLRSSQARTTSLSAAVSTLDSLISQPPPRRLSRRNSAVWNQQTEWLRSVRERYTSMATTYERAVSQSTPQSGVAGAAIPGANVLQNAIQGATGGLSESDDDDNSALSGQALLREMQAADIQFLALQESIQQESRQYQTVSSALKARQDTAMNTIDNLK